jgi:hypothetical protein
MNSKPPQGSAASACPKRSVVAATFDRHMLQPVDLDALIDHIVRCMSRLGRERTFIWQRWASKLLLAYGGALGVRARLKKLTNRLSFRVAGAALPR